MAFKNIINDILKEYTNFSLSEALDIINQKADLRDYLEELDIDPSFMTIPFVFKQFTKDGREVKRKNNKYNTFDPEYIIVGLSKPKVMYIRNKNGQIVQTSDLPDTIYLKEYYKTDINNKGIRKTIPMSIEQFKNSHIVQTAIDLRNVDIDKPISNFPALNGGYYKFEKLTDEEAINILEYLQNEYPEYNEDLENLPELYEEAKYNKKLMIYIKNEIKEHIPDYDFKVSSDRKLGRFFIQKSVDKNTNKPIGLRTGHTNTLSAIDNNLGNK